MQLSIRSSRRRPGSSLPPARLGPGVRRGVLIAESIWPNAFFPDGRGINTLTSADPIAPYGGAAFHDNRVALERVAPIAFEGPAARSAERVLA